jgi:hypothetical protein
MTVSISKSKKYKSKRLVSGVDIKLISYKQVDSILKMIKHENQKLNSMMLKVTSLKKLINYTKKNSSKKKWKRNWKKRLLDHSQAKKRKNKK